MLIIEVTSERDEKKKFIQVSSNNIPEAIPGKLFPVCQDLLHFPATREINLRNVTQVKKLLFSFFPFILCCYILPSSRQRFPGLDVNKSSESYE